MSQLSLDPGLQAALARIPALAGTTDADWERLGGLTNVVYRVATPAGPLAVRVPGKGTAAYIDRRVEAHNAQVAADADVAPVLVFADPDDGLMATAFLASATTMTGPLFRTRAGAPARAGALLRRLHGSPLPFTFRFELFAKIDEYLVYLAEHPAPLPAGYADALARSEGIRRQLAAHPVALVPSHCDPLAENFLDDGARMWLVDWEYSGMNDPMWDLGDLSVEAGFDLEQDEALLAGYFGGAATPADRGRFEIYKAMCDLLWTLWGLIQHANGNPAEDFLAYANDRFARCQRQLESPGFAEHLAAIG
ncbi:MAG: Choline/ethanolamine kinase [Cyanobacteria bacterium RYN_339]|nr:Choline/ethanolamine kinase [Cyanobacteria bacterium RYN_339]